MPAPIDDTKRAAILDDIRTGGTCRGIAREHGVSDATVRRLAKNAGIDNPWSRVNTENATRARVADMKAERAAEMAAALVDARKLRSRAWQPYVQVVGTAAGAELVTLDLPPLDQVRNAYTSWGILIDKHLKLDTHDSDTGGLAAVDQWLRDMMGGSQGAP